LIFFNFTVVNEALRVEKEFYNEAVLVQKLRDGDPFAFEKIFSHYSKRLYQFSFSYLKSDADAEDVVEEVFFKLWQNRKSLKTETSFQSYLFTITLNFIKRHFNKRPDQTSTSAIYWLGLPAGTTIPILLSYIMTFWKSWNY